MAQNTPLAGYGIVLVTVPSQQEGEMIAQALVETQMAACVNLMPVYSIYSWEGEINKDKEWQMVIKTELSLFPSLEQKILQLHSYEVPEIIALPVVAGSEEYLQWIADNTEVP